MEMVSVISGLIVLYLTIVSIRQQLESLLWILKIVEVVLVVLIFLLILVSMDDPNLASNFLDQLLKAIL